MHLRLLFWLCLCAFVAAGPLRAQVPPPVNAPMPEGQIKAVKVTGTVTKTVNGVVSPLEAGKPIEQKAKITTAANSSVVLAFSNGASTKVEADSELVIEEFLQDPLTAEVQVSKLEKEPTNSRTKLFLNKGEIVGEVKTLTPGGRSYFTVNTPVGAAGIRGTIFRIVFRPSGTGQAFFTLSTVTGQVNFEPATAGGAGGVTTTTATASGTVAGLAVPTGQEIAFDVSVTTNAQGQMVVTVLPPPPTTTSGISANTMQQATEAAREIATAVQNIIVSPPATPGGTPNLSGSGSGGTPTPPSNFNLNTPDATGTGQKQQTTQPIPASQVPTPP